MTERTGLGPTGVKRESKGKESGGVDLVKSGTVALARAIVGAQPDTPHPSAPIEIQLLHAASQKGAPEAFERVVGLSQALSAANNNADKESKSIEREHTAESHRIEQEHVAALIPLQDQANKVAADNANRLAADTEKLASQSRQETHDHAKDLLASVMSATKGGPPLTSVSLPTAAGNLALHFGPVAQAANAVESPASPETHSPASPETHSSEEPEAPEESSILDER